MWPVVLIAEVGHAYLLVEIVWSLFVLGVDALENLLVL